MITVVLVNGMSAFHLAMSLQPDVVLMDVGLGRFNGVDGTRHVKDLSAGYYDHGLIGP
jgi:DNA-binding NarL/FixJ family response regulator